MRDQLNSSRRSFLKSAAASAAAISVPGSVSALHAAGFVHSGSGEPLKIGLVGCGGRGSGAARQALDADKNNVLWAVGDAFMNRVTDSVDALDEAMEGSGRAAQVQVPEERRFAGLDCIDKVLDSGVDVILLASPPGFRPMQIEKAVQKGVHVFAEKPVATDAPGLRRVRAACEEARKKNLSVVSGLCYRYHDGRRAIVKRLQEGAIGDILAIQGNYITGELWLHQRQPSWTEMENQLRNWLYYSWLSGDLIAEQHIHSLDVMAWIKGDVYPARAYSLGGRQKRVAPEYGNVFDHLATVYEWQDGTRGYSYCRQQNGCFRDVDEYVIGSNGTARVFQHAIAGKSPWKYDGAIRDMYQAEHDEMFAAIRQGQRIDNSDYMINSTMMAIMGRMASYTGKDVTWKEAWESQEQLMPDVVTMDMAPPPADVAIPGLTKFR
ncbi:MAG: Gfo/Idh/MocA family oxidoreductase [Planctomycetota bacterium]